MNKKRIFLTIAISIFVVVAILLLKFPVGQNIKSFAENIFPQNKQIHQFPAGQPPKSAGKFQRLISKFKPTKIKPIFSYKVNGCGEGDQKQTKKQAGRKNSPSEFFNRPKTIRLEAQGNAVKYYRADYHLCCRQVEIKSDIRDNQIKIYEIWHGRGCRCQCYSSLEATVDKLKPGNYQVEVYKTGTDPVLDKGEPKLLISRKIRIPS